MRVTVRSSRTQFNVCLRTVAALVPQLRGRSSAGPGGGGGPAPGGTIHSVPAAVSLHQLEANWAAVAALVPSHQRTLEGVAGKATHSSSAPGLDRGQVRGKDRTVAGLTTEQLAMAAATECAPPY